LTELVGGDHARVHLDFEDGARGNDLAAVHGPLALVLVLGEKVLARQHVG